MVENRSQMKLTEKLITDDYYFWQGVPECVLFVAQRLTKYPLLLEPLLKTAGDDMHERELLQKALCGVKVRYTIQRGNAASLGTLVY